MYIFFGWNGIYFRLVDKIKGSSNDEIKYSRFLRVSFIVVKNKNFSGL